MMRHPFTLCISILLLAPAEGLYLCLEGTHRHNSKSEQESKPGRASRAAARPGETEKGEGTDEELESRPGWHPDFWEDDPHFPSVSFLGNDPTWNTDFREEPSSRVLLYPAKKLAFCYIEKNACTQFNHLFNRLNGFANADEADHPWWLSAMPAFGRSFSQTTRAQGWKWAVFLRDPLPRYLSAWGSKCMQREDDGENCVPAGMFSRGSLDDFEENVRLNRQGPAARAANPHWALQMDFCGGINIHEYDFVGYLRGNVTDQVVDMMQMVGANDSQVTSVVEEYFPVMRVKGHSSSLDPHVYYQHRPTQRGVKKIYQQDFTLPGLLPAFIQPALGVQPKLLENGGQGRGPLSAATWMAFVAALVW